MSLIFPRYKPDGLAGYYDTDFAHRRGDLRPLMWVNELGDQVLDSPFQSAEMAGGEHALGGLIPWKTMSYDDFKVIMDVVARWFSPGESRKNPFALGVILAPPKSVSLAALAGPCVQPVIMEAHRAAVCFVAGQLRRFLVTRKKGKNVPIRAWLLRFTHPFSRADDPQLHDHLEWIPDPSEGALHTYPWFFFQNTFRAIYHFALAAELSRRGFGVEVEDAQDLRWELTGVDKREILLFSTRSKEVEALARAGCRDSLSAALRWAALTSSKALPKFPGLSLGTARAGWEAECPPSRCAVSRGEQRESQDLVMPSLEKLFQKSSRANLLTLQGRALALCLGQSCDVGTAMQQAENFLTVSATRGQVLVTRVRSGRAFLLPESYRQERKLLNLVDRGLGRGSLLLASPPASGLDPKLNAALAVPNRIRIVSVPVPKELGIQYSPGSNSLSSPSLVTLKGGDVASVLAQVCGCSTADIVVACNSPFRHGDFLSVVQARSLFRGFGVVDPRKRHFTLREGKGFCGTVTRVEVRSGSVPSNPAQPWLELENRARRALCEVPPDYDETSRRAMNIAMAKRLVLSRPIEEPSDLIDLDLIVPLEDAKPGMELVVFKNHDRHRLGIRRHIRSVLPEGLRVGKKQTNPTLSFRELRELSEHFGVVERYKMRLVPGMRLHVERSFSQRKPCLVSLVEGEIVEVRGLDPCGSIALADGRLIPSHFRAFSPAFLLREVPKGCEVVLAQAPERNPRAWAIGFRSPKLVVFARDPAQFAGELDCEEKLARQQSRLKRVVRFVFGEGEFVPSSEECDKLLSLQKWTVAVTKGPEPPSGKSVPADLVSVVAEPTELARSRSKMKPEEPEEVPKPKPVPAESTPAPRSLVETKPTKRSKKKQAGKEKDSSLSGMN